MGDEKKQEWPQEPWEWREDGLRGDIKGDEDYTRVTAWPGAIDPEPAARIVACVNACQGIPTDDLVKGRLGKCACGHIFLIEHEDCRTHNCDACHGLQYWEILKEDKPDGR